MAMWSDWIIGIPIVLALISIPLGIYGNRRAGAQLRAKLPASPLQILDKRLAAGEISTEEYRYERYLLEKDE